MWSGISGSRTCPETKCLVQEVYENIENSQSMEYLWSQKTDIVEHTGVVIKFDLTPKISIDFGGLLEKNIAKAKLATMGTAVVSAGMSKSVIPSSEYKANGLIRSTTLEGRVTLKDFNSSRVKIKGLLVKLHLRSREEKEKALQVFNAIKDIDVGEYQLMTNNCRHYVIAIAACLKNLPEFEEKQWKEFQEEIQNILVRDNEKFQNCLSSCKYFLSQMLIKLKEIIEVDENENAEVFS